MQSRLYVESVLSALEHFDKNNLQVEAWNWFLRTSREYLTVDMEHSRLLAAQYPCRPRECFANALMVAMSEPDLRYVEGFATSIIPVEHAWVVDKHGAVYDPTWVMLDTPWTPDYFGVDVPIIVAAKHYAERTIMPAWCVFAAQQLRNTTIVSGTDAGGTNAA